LEKVAMFVDASIIRCSLGIATILAAAACCVAPARAGDAEDLVRVQRAIGYLDARQDDWSRFSKAERGQADEKTTCVSCHTGISYALARPWLGRFVSEADPAAPERRMIADVGLRVEHWAELDSPELRLMYDHDDQKKLESRGTEAVINALILAGDDARHERKEPSPASRKAFEHLWATQAKEGRNAGSWDWLNFGLEPWEATGSRAFGATLAAIAVGSSPNYLNRPLDEEAARGVGLLREYLRRRFPEENLYNRVWILDASTRFEGLLSAPQKREVVDELLTFQNAEGGWALAALGDFERVDGTAQAQEPDGYATGLCLHVLLRAGSLPNSPEVARGLGWLRSHQRADGSWPGRSVNKERDPSTFVGKLMSDAATAIAALSLVEAASR
jgi:hypothetical protein